MRIFGHIGAPAIGHWQSSGLLRRAFAPLRKRFAFVAGNDASGVIRGLDPRIDPSWQAAFFRRWMPGSSPGMTNLPATLTAPELCKTASLDNRGRRECRARDAPAASRAKSKSTQV